MDGATGRRLWAIPGINQFVGSPVFIDINNDNIQEVFIGGRWAQLAAINGADGKIAWSFFRERKKPDGSNGGDARAATVEINRPAGRLLVLSSKTGKILANVVVPDGKETYMSVVCEGNTIYFGTGGETIGGHLYRTSLADIMKGDISQAKALATSDKKGFVSSPVLVDINNDGVRDIIDNAADLNGDGYDEAIVNQSALKKTQFENQFYSEIVVFDFINNTRTTPEPKIPATNLASTPYIGDLDNDNKFAIVYCAVQYPNAAYELSLPIGLYIHRYATGKEIKTPVRWGAFMGSDHNGVFFK